MRDDFARRDPADAGTPRSPGSRSSGALRQLGPMASQTPLRGYCDRLSVRPGESVRFHVGAREGEVPYRADVVRLRCADLQPGGARLRLGVEPGPGAAEISLSVSVYAADLPPDAARRALDPGASGSPLERVALEAAQRAAASHGARIESREAPGWLEVCVRFPALDAA